MMKAFRFDHVFYTGSTNVGRKVYELAANQLGARYIGIGRQESLCCRKRCQFKVAARRITVTKFSNAGQMCVAPDYLLVQESVKSDFIDTLKQTILQFYSADASLNYRFWKDH
jgi:aldehyde dehydrogenase (NAD+)